MSSNLPPVPVHTQMLDFQGYVTPYWRDWFQKVFVRAGGNVAETNDELYSVDTARIDAGAVTSAKIADGAVGTTQLADGGVSTAKLADDAVSFDKIRDSDWGLTISTEGYTRLPNGLIVQWGETSSVASGGSAAIVFPVEFATACLQVFSSVKDNSAVATTATGQWGTGAYSQAGCSLYNRTSVALTFNWIALGH